jgi:hypothetical protein
MADRVAYMAALPVLALASLLAAHGTAGRAASQVTPEPSTQLACDLAHSIAGAEAGTSVQRSRGVFSHGALREPVRGCRLVIEGSFEESPPGEDAIGRLRDGFAAQGWQEMPAYSADGKDGTAFALRKNEVACLFRGSWDGGSDGEPPLPRERTYRVSVLCTSPAPPAERTAHPRGTAPNGMLQR